MSKVFREPTGLIQEMFVVVIDRKSRHSNEISRPRGDEQSEGHFNSAQAPMLLMCLMLRVSSSATAAKILRR